MPDIWIKDGAGAYFTHGALAERACINLHAFGERKAASALALELQSQLRQMDKRPVRVFYYNDRRNASMEARKDLFDHARAGAPPHGVIVGLGRKER